MSDMMDMIDDPQREGGGIVAPVPRISIQVFTETQEVTQVVQAASQDRRMAKAHIRIQTGGAGAAVEAYRNQPTPNVIIIESRLNAQTLLGLLDELAGQCDAGTRVIVIGHVNDVLLYRELLRRGVSDYIIAPLSMLGFIRSISDLYVPESGGKLGRIISVIGTKGGVGASTICHNVAWSIARDLDVETVIADLDLAFGTGGLDFNQDPPQGVAEAVFAPDRLDSGLVDRLLSRCADKLSLLAAPATLERPYDFSETAFDGLIDIMRATTPYVALDVPHAWTAWTRRMLVGADEVVLVAQPDLANLRNVKSILDTLRVARPNDSRPKLVMNGIGVLKRPEIGIAEFSRAVELEPACIIPYDARLFGTAANNGQMIAEVEASNAIAATFSELGRAVTGRFEIKRAKKNLLDPILARLRKRA